MGLQNKTVAQMKHRYVLKARVLKRMIAQGHNMTCQRKGCGEPFKADDVIVSVRWSTAKGGKTKRYHEDCWNNLFLG